MRPGDQVANRFRIVALAGSGGMGSVYRAVDTRTGEDVALKVVGSSSGALAMRFSREAELLADLRHPCVVRYIAHGRTDGGELYLAMEWLAGEDLAHRLAHTGLSTRESLELVRHVADGLAAAHDRGTVHRDIKPSNVFLIDGDVTRVKILDFGIAFVRNAPSAMTRTGTTIGTPGYMAPEQARGERDLDQSVDVFSLGCVLFECLTGEPPFVGDGPMAVLAKILLAEPPRLAERRSDLPASLDALVARMLSKDRTQRPRDGAAVARELEAIGDVAESPRVPASARPPALTTHEQRLACVVLVARTPATVRTLDSWRDGMAVSPLAATASAETVAVEDVDDRLSALWAAVNAHGGRAELLADGSVVATIFGQGTATDRAAQAARCALAIRQAMPDPPMALSIGRSVVTGIAPVGEVIDRAARLLGPSVATPSPMSVPHRAAAPTSRPIRVDEATAGLLDGRFALGGDEHGLFLTGERDVSDAGRTLLGRPTPCVGRARELGALEAIFDESVEEPMAHVVLVTAPAGFGKSRLRHEFIQRVLGREAPVEIWIGRGDSMSAGSPFGMLAQALRRAAGILNSEPIAVRYRKLRARVSRHVPPREIDRVADFLGELIEAPKPGGESVPLAAARRDPQLMGDQMLRAWEDFICAECDSNPVLLVLEDLHWGDLPTVRFVDAALRRAADQPLMVLALARPEIEGLFPRLFRDRGVEAVHLGELPRRAAEKLVRTALGDDVGADTVQELVERAGGNAFYLEELVRAIADGKRTGLPETVLAMAQARIEALEPEARQVLRAASVFGEVFWKGAVMALLGAGQRTTQVHDWLKELCERELVVLRRDARFRGEAEYVFRHALVRDAAYSMLTDRDRALGHRLAGAWLEDAGEPEPAVLAEHFERGSDPQRAMIWYRRAAEQALEGHDLAVAIEWAERAIRCGESSEEGALPPTDLGALRQLQAEAHTWRSEYDAGEECAAAALALLPRGSSSWFMALATLSENSGRTLHFDRTRQAGAELANAEPRVGAYAAYAYAVAMTIATLLTIGEVASSERLLDRVDALEPRVRGSDPVGLAWILHARSWRAMHLGDVAACLALDTEVVQCFESADDARRACQQLGNVGYDEVILGGYERAESSLREAEATAERMGLVQVSSQARHNLGLALLRLGRIDEARRVELASADEFVRHGNMRLEAAARTYVALIEIAAGHLEEAEQACRRSIELSAGLPLLAMNALAAMAQIRRLAGRAAEAVPLAEQACANLTASGVSYEGEAFVRLEIAECLLAAGRAEAARDAIASAERRLRERADRIGDAEWRRTFLERVPENARTLELARILRAVSGQRSAVS